MQASPVSALERARAYAARSAELACLLRSAVTSGDEARITTLLSELLRVRGLPKARRVRLQLRALSNLVHALRAQTLNDEATGLGNRRGFVQSATRLIDLAMRDGQPLHLIHFCLGPQPEPRGGFGHCAGDLQARQLANFMRDLYPSYGVYEVLGRLGGAEFAALTPSPAHAVRECILQRARTRQRGCAEPLPLSIGVARFDPAQPRCIDELLHEAAQAAATAAQMAPIASSGYAPQPELTLCQRSSGGVDLICSQ